MKYFLSILFILFFSASCRSPDEAPELRDPIYQDLLLRATKAEKLLKDLEKEESLVKEYIVDIPPQTGKYIVRWDEYFTVEKEVRKQRQFYHYLQIKAEKRKRKVRIQYLKAYLQDKEDQWPDPKEYQNYRVQRDLAEAAKPISEF